jgi:hypothetical protein
MDRTALYLTGLTILSVGVGIGTGCLLAGSSITFGIGLIVLAGIKALDAFDK